MKNLFVQGLVILLFTSCTGRPPAEASGAEIYQQLCSNCHGSDLSGGIAPALGAGSNASTQDDAFLEFTISRGRGRMPSFRSTLSAEQIDRVIGFMRDQQQ